MGKVVFFNLPGASGHVNPTISIVSELVARGEEVIFYSSEEFRDRFIRLGVEFRTYDEWTDHRVTPQISEDILPAVLAQFNMLLAVANPLLHRTRTDAPDYIIYDSVCIWGKFIASTLGVPGISCITMIVSSPLILITDWRISARTVKALIQGLPKAAWGRRMLIETMRNMGLKYRGALYHVFDFFASVGDLNIVFNAQQLQPYHHFLKGNFRYIGSSFGPLRDASIIDFSNFKFPKLIYISLGTVQFEALEFYRLCLRCFEHEEVNVILSAGYATDIQSLGPIPANCSVLPFVPQLEVLSHADLFISHGGMNSINESLYYGVPLVIVPQQFEQAYNGRRMKKEKVALLLNRNTVTEKKLLAVVNQVLDDSEFSRRAAVLGTMLKASGGYLAAVDTILEFVAADSGTVSGVTVAEEKSSALS